ncbi:UDP-N-acetylmuramoylalanyl-D-glutamyl-2,6-diaminopimelate--D-alanyl-D-alanine ligase [Segnochrobactrum spirostomi]|uniref:UDP-N-acetylmuramoyl-tripeptide--D-alanyl-D-alanine ligase n=1 Tax=Segnochrobactrum spirostomi TaxID=2608987 RepID=A0A6A7Y651_9HYPH|nr:UDP-N-acetylmuramoylalanyl-D-glutamyl-2,6-diaminopimelate--D-alanyl-D-alanine ligase [Segnochrobactrum spirostomi]MQT13787.1 UDP-N-acetylmuramoylalanyl-D-glutamyl-2,6-diaminopimelate--D-alanyl-D-alanine ligase [Segnochrobactrum spirostomi]
MSAPLWRIEAIRAATGGRLVGALDGPIAGLSIDSRTAAPGEIFFAIRGERLDGHDFVADVLTKGAAIAVVAEDKLAALPPHGRYLIVPDVLAALVDLARAARARSAAGIVGVTGSVGKTSTKEALRAALGACGSVHASAASFNNHWGVPLSLARLPEDARFAVFEIGMSAPGEITPLTRLVRPQVAIITTIAAAHAANFPNEEAIADAKAEIFLGLEPDGVAILNRDNRHFERLAAAARKVGATIVSFGESAEADVRLLGVDLDAEHSDIRASVSGREIAYRLGAPGRHLALNSLAIAAAVDALGADLALAMGSLAGAAAPVGRGRRLTLVPPGGGTFLLIDEAYNANPASMRAAFAVLALAPVGAGGRRIAVLGDMLELGAESAALHRALAADLEAAGIDVVHCCGPMMLELFRALPSSMQGAYAETSAVLESAVAADLRAGDALMVKGSNGSRMGPLVTSLATRFAAPPAGRPGD